ncbi:MAG: hypothetical protein EA001_13260 [Oscillatoriales cyanobacterium]|nr:MAG: hypothetical protein EA001_13260 [Oscillatoriales cyanobacterium]
MHKTYSTQALLDILAEEQRACMQGRRLSLRAKVSGIDPLDRLIDPKGIQKFTAYQNFRDQIHAYQQQQGVSGLVWKSLSLATQGETHHLTYPELHDQLIALAEDVTTLQRCRGQIIDFWLAITAGFDIHLSVAGGREFCAITEGDRQRLTGRAEWASLDLRGRRLPCEVVLQLGWGDPALARYRRDWPQSGSEYVHAVPPGHSPMP